MRARLLLDRGSSGNACSQVSQKPRCMEGTSFKVPIAAPPPGSAHLSGRFSLRSQPERPEHNPLRYGSISVFSAADWMDE